MWLSPPSNAIRFKCGCDRTVTRSNWGNGERTQLIGLEKIARTGSTFLANFSSALPARNLIVSELAKWVDERTVRAQHLTPGSRRSFRARCSGLPRTRMS